MKYIVLIFLFVLITTNYGIAQTTYGLKGGINLTVFNEDQGQFGETPDAEIGYFGGVFVDVKLSERFHFQPELLYKGVGDFEFINAPIYVEYDVTDDISLLAGPSLNYFFDIFINRFKVRGDVSAAYHFTENIELNLKYTVGFEEIAPNVLFLGMGFSL